MYSFELLWNSLAQVPKAPPDTDRNFRFGPPAFTVYTLSSPEHNELVVASLCGHAEISSSIDHT